MLTDYRILSAKVTDKSYKITDSNGLYIEIWPSGSRLWRYRYRISGKENLFALGEYPPRPIPPSETEEDREARLKQRVFTLSEARDERLRARGLVKQGIHPAHDARLSSIRRRHSTASSFEAVANRWMKECGQEWGGLYRKNIQRTFSRDVFPSIGAVPIGAIGPEHVLGIVNDVKARSASAANQVRMWLGAVFRFAKSQLLIKVDPTYSLDGQIKLPKTKHHRHLPLEEIGPFLKELDGCTAWAPTRIASQLLWLTLVRVGEVIKAEWAEFDLEQAIWRIPAERMKMRQVHEVPLSRQAVALLTSLHAISGHCKHAFISPFSEKKPLSYIGVRHVFGDAATTLAFVEAFTPHGVRSSFSTLTHEAGVRPDVIERCLAHQERDATRRAYNRSTLFSQRKELMQQWADLLDRLRTVDPKAGPIVVSFAP